MKKFQIARKGLLRIYAVSLTGALMCEFWPMIQQPWLLLAELIFWSGVPLGIVWCSLENYKFSWLWGGYTVFMWFTALTFGAGLYLMILSPYSNIGLPIKSKMLYESYIPGFLVLAPWLMVMTYYLIVKPRSAEPTN